MAEPIFLNPKSYNNIKLILDQLKVMLDLGGKRKWPYVGCDGPLYVIASRLIESDIGKYDWVTMSRCLGHLYMNQQKALFSIARNILLEPLPKYVLNFESPNVLDYFFKCADTHRTNQSLEIFLYGTDLQMVYEYVAQTDEEQQNLSRGLSVSVYLCTSNNEKQARISQQQWKNSISWQI